jgi:hypothetical protein
MLRTALTIILFQFFFHSTFAQVELNVNLNHVQFLQGDTLVSECILNYKDIAYATATLHVWIENTSGTKRWKYRYPLINGKCLFNLEIDKTLSNDVYAINYIVQPQFFTVKAHVKNYNSSIKGISMLLISKGMDNYTSNYIPDTSGNFKINRILFSDTAQFTFTSNTKKGGDVWVNIETPLDSNFTPVTKKTVFVTIGDKPSTPTETYEFDSSNFTTRGKLLTEIVITADVKSKKINEFKTKNVTGLFKSVSASREINGIDNQEMMQSIDIFAYLQTQVTGLEIIRRGNWYSVLKKGFPVDIFLDEVRTTTEEILFLHPGDVALVKIYDPGAAPTMGYGGVLAIYSKKGDDLKAASKQKSVYKIFGYSPQIAIWK